MDEPPNVDLDLAAGIETDVEDSEKIFLDYLIEIYAIFMAGSDAFEEMDKKMMDAFDAKNGIIITDVDRLTKEHECLQIDYDNLSKSEAPVVILERELVMLQSDKEKFETYMNLMDTKLSKLNASIESEKEEISATECVISQLNVEKQKLQNIIDAQELSPADVDRLNAERDQLTKSLEACRMNLDELNKTVWQGEITLQKTMDQLEKGVREFNTQIYKLGLIGSDSPFDGLCNELELDINASNPLEMVNIDLARVFKPSCNAFIAQQKKQTREINDLIFAIQEQLDSISWKSLQETDQISVIRGQLEVSNKQYQDEKQVHCFFISACNQAAD